MGVQSLRSIVALLQDAIEDVRRISMNLRPSLLDELGLLPTISWLVRQFAEAHPQVVIESEVNVAERDVPESTKIVVYRVLQEALSNVAKHAAAERIAIRLAKEGADLVLEVSDNGRGFEPIAQLGRGLGLTSMRYRAEMSGGRFSLESAEGQGTRVTARWPGAVTTASA